MTGDQRKRRAVGALLAGLVCAAIGKALGFWPLGIVAVPLMIGGGMVLAGTYREEAGRPPRVSRFALASRMAASKGRGSLARNPRRSAGNPAARASTNGGKPGGPGAGGPAGAGATVPGLRLYAANFDRVLTRCRDLLDTAPNGGQTEQIGQARDELMVLVASVSYGPALSAGLIDESGVREVSTRLAARLA